MNLTRLGALWFIFMGFVFGLRLIGHRKIGIVIKIDKFGVGKNNENCSLPVM